MNVRNNVAGLLVGLFLASFAATPAAAAKNEKPPSRKQILEKFSLEVDPGTDPDPSTVYTRNGVPYTIVKFPKSDALPSSKGEGWIRFLFLKASDYEIYQTTDEAYWVFVPKPAEAPKVKFNFTNTGGRVKVLDYPESVIADMRRLKEEFVPVVPPESGRLIAFRDVSSGLPRTGSWRNSGDSADMNGDGHIDIVLPPQRGPAGVPSIYLGDGRGNWKPWKEASFPYSINYGSVSVGDLNGDGHLDLAFAVHLDRPAVLLGDGKGRFEDGSEGIPDFYPSRRLRIGDVDVDGDQDLIVSSEGPVKGVSTPTGQAKLIVLINDGSGAKWVAREIGPSERTLGGDWLALADVNGDGNVDVVGSSVYFHGRDLVHLGVGPARWEPFGLEFFPADSFYLGLTTGRFSRSGRDEAIFGFQRAWRYTVDPDLVSPPTPGTLQGIERVAWNDDGSVTRTPIIQWHGGKQAMRAIGSGDFDGDGNRDVVFLDTERLELRILLGSGDGTFSAARAEGISVPDNEAYDLHVTDFDGDGRDDILMLFEAAERLRDGSVRAYMNQGAKAAEKP